LLAVAWGCSLLLALSCFLAFACIALVQRLPGASGGRVVVGQGGQQVPGGARAVGWLVARARARARKPKSTPHIDSSLWPTKPVVDPTRFVADSMRPG